jgi:hypothetical protein
MIIHDNIQFHPPVVLEKIFKNFSQSEAIMSPGSHVGWLIGTKVTPLLLFVPIGHPTWLPEAIKASDGSKFQSTFRESLKQMGPNLAGMFLCSHIWSPLLL